MTDGNEFEDIIDLPHHQSKKHPQMSNYDRAAQFMPFAALKGYDDEVEEAARITSERQELDESKIDEMNETVRVLQERMKSHPRVRVTYFVPDVRKDGGAYLQYEGQLRRIVEAERSLIFSDGMEIALDDISQIEIREDD